MTDKPQPQPRRDDEHQDTPAVVEVTREHILGSEPYMPARPIGPVRRAPEREDEG